MRLKDKKVPVLFILMEFPPVNTTGNYRSLKFIKYLVKFGIEPIVVTFIENEGAEFFNTKIDYKLLGELPAECIVYKVHCNPEKKSALPAKISEFLRIYFSIKDSFAKRWSPFLFNEIKTIIKKHNPELVYTSLPPFSSGLLTKKIARKYNLPYVLDMRDLWSHWGSGPLASRVHYWLTRYEENKIYRDAAKVIAVTPQMIDVLKSCNPSIDGNKFKLIFNGFDFETNQLDSIKLDAGKEKIVIGYLGSFYYEPTARINTIKPWWKKGGHKMLQYSPTKQDWLYRSPYFFLKTIAIINSKYPEIGNAIKIEFIGKKQKWLDNMIAEFGLSDKVILHGFVDQTKAYELQLKWDMLLATSEKVIDGEHYCLPSKLFDYLKFKKPILGFVTSGIQKEFIETGNLGLICNPDNLNEAADKIVELINNGRLFQPDISYLKQFQIEGLTKQLADVLLESIDYKKS